MRALSVACVLLLSALAAAAEPSTVINPRWIERPRGESFGENYPVLALAQMVTGRVILDCLVQIDTSAQCTVASEEPGGWGFGEGALVISRGFRISPRLVDGRPEAGGRVRVPIAFSLRDTDLDSVRPLPAWDDAPTAEAMQAIALRHRVPGGRGIALLRCVIRADRRLNCEGIRETEGAPGPRTRAALEASTHFRVAEFEFADAPRFAADQAIFLPVTFGWAPEVSPLLPDFAYDPGADAVVMPSPPRERIVFWRPPTDPEGRATVMCAVNSQGRLDCALAQQTSAEAGALALAFILGEVALLQGAPFWSGLTLRFDIEFGDGDGS